ncbi:phosphoglycerate mutase-like protein [Exidia glandulosa HHB12029]|uniref:Phosphoglycerate mutase-like protein n=1 Tax=Exidia glandulosa HHB12029 TaxID=1314781 RepID=A0A166B2J4_EXIGL|nr:phosphoglycerate mutase-like protein [Exidia glandulosa HHB12029]
MSLSFTYSLVPGIFVQDTLEYVASLEQVEPNFGLTVDAWPDVAALNEQAPEGTSYKLVFAGRHGQGFHNVAESKYGTEAWEAHWAFLSGDNEATWGPDPYLTDVGVQQAKAAHAAWAKYKPPQPDLYLCSPLRRALQTFQGTFPDKSARVEENVRERIDGHTCDIRLPVSQLQSEYPTFDWSAMKDDEDPHTKLVESEAAVAERARTVLDAIFAHETAQIVSITTHSGWIKGLGDALGRKRYILPTGGVAPFLIKAVRT